MLHPWQPVPWATLLLAAWSAPVTRAVTIWSNENAQSMLSKSHALAVPSNEEIKAKWDNMDEFLKIMFTLACKWKHGKDVNGLAASELRSGSITGGEVKQFKADIQQANMKRVKQACGLIVAKGKKRCRQGCASRWGDEFKDRSRCDDSCVSAYGKFESSCTLKAGNLEKVYAMKLSMADSRERCHKGHCEHHPTVLMKATEAEMKAELDTQCQGQCTAEQITTRCQRKWQLEVDFIRTSVRATCQDQSAVMSCFDGKKATATTNYDACSSGAKGTCDTQYTECTTKGKTESTFKEAGDFCTQRKKMCYEQVSKDCLASNKAELEKGKAECEKESSDALDQCETDTLGQKETQAITKCEGELGPKCTEDCTKKCDVDGLSQCLKNLEGQGDPAEAFCEDFWQLLHESSEVDPVTGNPIVLLASSSPRSF